MRACTYFDICMDEVLYCFMLCEQRTLQKRALGKSSSLSFETKGTEQGTSLACLKPSTNKHGLRRGNTSCLKIINPKTKNYRLLILVGRVAAGKELKCQRLEQNNATLFSKPFSLYESEP